MSCNLLTDKDPDEAIVVTFDFSPALDAGETLSSIESVTVEVSAGVDPAPGDILTGQAIITVDSLMVQQPVVGGVNGVNYNIKALAQTSTPSKRLAVTAILPVRSQ